VIYSNPGKNWPRDEAGVFFKSDGTLASFPYVGKFNPNNHERPTIVDRNAKGITVKDLFNSISFAINGYY
jgi:hypothetical protein